MALSPANLPELYECLKAALSSDTATRQNAEAQLKHLETHDNFSSCLAVRLQYHLHQSGR